MTEIPSTMSFGPFKHQTTRGEITVQGNFYLEMSALDFQKGVVTSISTTVSVDINTDTDNFRKKLTFGKYMTPNECVKIVLEFIAEFEKTGKLL